MPSNKLSRPRTRRCGRERRDGLVGFRRGFKADAERLALSTREELGLGAYRRLAPARLAEHLAIPVLTLSDLLLSQHAMPELASAIGILHGSEMQAMSAVTVFCGSQRVIVHNDAHAPGRQASNLAHELSHALLLHPSAPVVDLHGCRKWNREVEDEASYLAGALLVPAKAAWWLAKRGLMLEQAAEEFGCSIEMIRWRINITGAGRRLAG